MSAYSLVIWIIILFGFMYWFMIKPQNDEVKHNRAMYSDLKPGDRIRTTGKMYGTIVSIDGDDTVIEFGEDENKIQVAMRVDGIEAVDRTK
ncbi:MAG: preprotein translocase subunit YajC [Pseudobutyrivibrio sp.]|nr:preprotein translocase subunit YajC [Pseudobutyrivibrio sp.]